MRVVSLTCSNTEILHALGAVELLVGVDDHSDWPEEPLRGIPRLGPDLHIDVDAVEALHPDLVLASLTVPGHERVVEALDARGLPWIAPEPTRLEHVARDIRVIADAIGRSADGERAAQRFEARIEAASAPPGDVPVLVEWWPRPVYVPGRDSWVTQLLTRAGGRNPFADRPVPSFAATPDEVRAAAPQASVISWCGVPTARYRVDKVLGRPGWEHVPAVRAQRVFPVPEAWLGRPGPRLVDGLEALKQVVQAVTRAREGECSSAG